MEEDDLPNIDTFDYPDEPDDPGEPPDPDPQLDVIQPAQGNSEKQRYCEKNCNSL